MHNAIGLKMLWSDLQFGCNFVARSMEKVQTHCRRPATETAVDLGSEVFGLRFIDFLSRCHGLSVFSHHVNLTCHTTTRLFRFRETCDF